MLSLALRSRSLVIRHPSNNSNSDSMETTYPNDPPRTASSPRVSLGANKYAGQIYFQRRVFLLILIAIFVFVHTVYFGSAVTSSTVTVDDPAISTSSHSLFDKMHKKFHQLAATPNHHVEKKIYEVGVSLPRGTGGLKDTDRQLLADIYSNVNSVFEFGLGESTKIAAWVGVPRYVGVDSDANWVTNTRNEVNMDHFRFIFADIGATGSYGRPQNNKLQKIALSYQSSPLNDEMEAFDFYLIDGRYRVSCACASMLHAMRHGGNMTQIMFGVHDYPGRPWYHKLEALANIVRESELLRVFQVKSNTTQHDIYQMWEENFKDMAR